MMDFTKDLQTAMLALSKRITRLENTDDGDVKRFGTVESVSGDSALVIIDGDDGAVPAVCLCSPSAGDRVLVSIRANGSCVALGVVGGASPTPAGSQTYVHNQTTSAAVWTIMHGLGDYPSVSVVDSAGSAVVGDVDYISNDELAVSFKAAFKGTAYLNH